MGATVKDHNAKVHTAHGAIIGGNRAMTALRLLLHSTWSSGKGHQYVWVFFYGPGLGKGFRVRRSGIGLYSIITCLGGPHRTFAGTSVGGLVGNLNVHRIGFVCPNNSKHLGALGFILGSRTCLSRVLSYNRHISNSSLFDCVRTSDSSLCIIPHFTSTFISPFTGLPALYLLYSFFGGSNSPLRSSPRCALRGTYTTFGGRANLRFRTVNRLRCCIVTPRDRTFPTISRHNCRRSTPFTGFGRFHRGYVRCVSLTNNGVGCNRSRINGFARSNGLCRRGRVRFLPYTTRSTTGRLAITG